MVKSQKELDAIASEAITCISEISHLYNQLKHLDSRNHQEQRMIVVKLKVDIFFAWMKSVITLPAENITRKALRYCINQEGFLQMFLTDGDIPKNNNPAERALRPFTLGRKNWVNTYMIKCADSSAII